MQWYLFLLGSLKLIFGTAVQINIKMVYEHLWKPSSHRIDGVPDRGEADVAPLLFCFGANAK
jgi:hypothetical protein